MLCSMPPLQHLQVSAQGLSLIDSLQVQLTGQFSEDTDSGYPSPSFILHPQALSSPSSHLRERAISSSTREWRAATPGFLILDTDMWGTILSVGTVWCLQSSSIPGSLPTRCQYHVSSSDDQKVLRHFWWPQRAKITLIESHFTVWSSATRREALTNNSLLIPAPSVLHIGTLKPPTRRLSLTYHETPKLWIPQPLKNDNNLHGSKPPSSIDNKMR